MNLGNFPSIFLFVSLLEKKGREGRKTVPYWQPA